MDASGVRGDVDSGHTSTAAAGEPTSVSSKRNIRAICSMERTELNERPLSVRVSDAITRFAGTTTCLAIHVLWFGGWILWNGSLLPLPPFDPFPFSFMTLVVSLEAIFLSLFIMMSQSRMQRLADERSHLDLQINLLAENETTKMLGMLRSLCAHFDLPEATDEDIPDLELRTDPEALLGAIKRSLPE